MRILLVEDEERLAESVARGLRAAAHAVDVAPRLAAARTRLALEPYDALVLDVGLPDGSGFDLAAEVRRRALPMGIVMLTARDTVEDRVHGLDLGADDYLVKPFALEELLARLRAVHRRGPDRRPLVLQVADLAIDPASRTARRGDRAIELTTTEFGLLQLLAERAGEVCSRAMIAAHVWDESFDPLSNIIDVYVARLRRKVDAEGDAPLLHTVRGAGYVLDPARSAAA
ncbi:MAG: response regulator transcription factor [Gemmatimonadales bacterium]|nr:response regulator transcription factor [Gemmatimonadales bacterium]